MKKTRRDSKNAETYRARDVIRYHQSGNTKNPAKNQCVEWKAK